MKLVYEVSGITKQGHWQNRRRREKFEAYEEMLLKDVMQLRLLHPAMGGKKLYRLLMPESMGRDQFLLMLSSSGLLAERPRNRMRTTHSVKSWRYSNLLDGLVLRGSDEVWVSDITYFLVNGECYYIVLIMDLYTRKLLGYSVEKHMRAESCMAALRMAFDIRGKAAYSWSLIHHSDRGTQYASNIYTNALEDKQVKISMCLIVYENAHMERLNGIIKNEYLELQKKPKNLQQLKRMLAKTASLYNDHRPHQALNFLSPTQFEREINKIPIENRKEMKVYTDSNTKMVNELRNQLNMFSNYGDM